MGLPLDFEVNLLLDVSDISNRNVVVSGSLQTNFHTRLVVVTVVSSQLPRSYVFSSIAVEAQTVMLIHRVSQALRGFFITDLRFLIGTKADTLFLKRVEAITFIITLVSFILCNQDNILRLVPS